MFHGMDISSIVYPLIHRQGSLKQLVTPVVQGFLKGDLHGSSSSSGSLAHSCVTQQAILLFRKMSSKMDTSTLKSLISSLYVKKKKRDFPGGPVPKILRSQCRDPSSAHGHMGCFY